MQLPDKVKLYLDKNSSTKWKLEWSQTNGIENTVVIPAIAESENIQVLLSSLSKNEKQLLNETLLMFVINNLASSDKEIKKDNQKSISYLRSLIKKYKDYQDSRNTNHSGMVIGLVDAASEGNEFGDKTGGVGLARKIGMDLALTAFDYTTSNKKIIISLDADCTVDKSYLSAITDAFNDLSMNAATMEFAHNKDSGADETAILGYEIFLRYYVVGLLYAQSPYAYHTIGSTFACDHEAYIKVGGMNTRKAAEDFYFLQKLAKSYSIGKINDTVVNPSARESWRVPFGTGKSVMKLQEGEKQLLLYDPQIFNILKEWLEFFKSDYSLNTEALLLKAENIHLELYNFLVSKNFSTQWEKILKNSASEKQLSYQRKNWFDAFNTLKLIHHLRDSAFPMREINSAIKQMLELLDYNYDFEHDIDDNIINLKECLSVFRKIENSFSNQVSIGYTT